MNRPTTFLLCIVLLFTLGAEGCAPEEDTADSKATEDVRQMTSRLYSQVGTPEVQNFQEYKFAKQIMELRDKKITTYTYYLDRQGRKHFVCESVGYGLPYSTQLTPPEKPEFPDRGKWNDYALPQREPNGLFMPDNVSATWILCSDDEGGVTPYYSEPPLLVTPVRLERNVIGD